MTFKSLQVLRTTDSLRNEKGHPIAIGTRVVVIKQDGDTIVARRADRPAGVTGRLLRITGTTTQFAQTFRGRPKGSTKPTTVTAQAKQKASKKR